MSGNDVRQPGARALKNARHERYCQLCAQGGTKRAAYASAYGKGLGGRSAQFASVHAAALERRADVAARLAWLRERAAEQAIGSRAQVLRELWRVACCDVRKLFNDEGRALAPHELPDDVAAAVARVSVSQDGRFSYVLADKNPALDRLMRYFGLYEKDNQQAADPLRELAQAVLGKTVGPQGINLEGQTPR